MYKHVIDDLRIVVIDVEEFKETPVFCKSQANASNDSSKLLSKKGGMYVRKEKATSELISTSDEMRDLVGRALLKKGDQLLHSIEALIRGRSSEEPSATRQIYEEDLRSARKYLAENLNPSGEIRGFWEIVAFPQNY